MRRSSIIGIVRPCQAQSSFHAIIAARGRDLVSLNILVVDDFLTVRKMIRSALKNLPDVTITEADSAFLAWSLLKKNRYDLLLTDWMMPEMSGLELVQKVRAHPAIAGMRIVMISAESEAEKRAIAHRVGVDGFLPKPFAADALNREITRLFGTSRAT
jgi:two-component system chemotaxis response regulator CheY